MTAKLNIKIVGTDPLSQSVLVVCNTSESVKPIDEYSPIAFSMVGQTATTPEEFMQSIVSICNIQARNQDELDRKAATFDLSSWVGKTSTVDLPPAPTENAQPAEEVIIPPAGEMQVAPISNPEVEL